MTKKLYKMKYEVNVGRKDVSDFMRGADLGVDGVTDTVLDCVLTTSSKLSDKLIEGHKTALRKGLESDYYVGEIKFIK